MTDKQIDRKVKVLIQGSPFSSQETVINRSPEINVYSMIKMHIKANVQFTLRNASRNTGTWQKMA